MRCADVTFEMGDGSYGTARPYEADVGALLWNSKAGEGHVLVRQVSCGEGGSNCGCGGWGQQPCPASTMLCECGEDDSWRDHHYEVLARTSNHRLLP